MSLQVDQFSLTIQIVASKTHSVYQTKAIVILIVKLLTAVDRCPNI